MNIDPATLGGIAFAVAIVVTIGLSCGMAFSNIFGLGRARKAEPTSEGSYYIYTIVGGLMILVAVCSRAMMDGTPWYRELIPVSWSSSGLGISFSYSLFAYVVIAWGLLLHWWAPKASGDDDSDRLAPTMTAYTWTCRFCGAANEPGLAACQKCNFPAEATFEELALARAAGSPAAVYKARGKKARGALEWGELPFREQVLSAIFMVLMAVGFTLGGLTEHYLLGFGIVAGLSAILWVAHKVRVKPK